MYSANKNFLSIQQTNLRDNDEPTPFNSPICKKKKQKQKNLISLERAHRIQCTPAHSAGDQRTAGPAG